MIIARSVSKLLWNVRQNANAGWCARLCNLIWLPNVYMKNNTSYFWYKNCDLQQIAQSGRTDANGFLVDAADLMDLYFSM